MSHPTTTPTAAHMDRAFAQLRKPGWPTLQELAEAARHYGMVRARAVAMANGQTFPAEPTAAPTPEPRGVFTPVVRPPPPQRRRSDPATAFDPRAAAAGEYVHHLTDDAASA